MIRHRLSPRVDWPEKVERLGFDFHTIDGETYWDESAAYEFTADEIDQLEAATAELHRLCLTAMETLSGRVPDAYGLPPGFAQHLRRSWRRRDPELYGRFDLAWDGQGPPKLLEFNADTPTAILEASVVQWYWLQDVNPEADQFNSIHEKLLETWAGLGPRDGGGPFHFTCVRDHAEDLGTTRYLMDTAIQAGLEARFLFIDEIGWDQANRIFADLDGQPITRMFKLYPWEWLRAEDFGPNLLLDTCRVLEPPWKLLLSAKAILPILWEMFPGHPNLLPAHFDPAPLEGKGRAYVQKPIYGREGADITTVADGRVERTGEGVYGAEGFVFQARADLPEFDGNYPVIGSWVVGGRPAGLGIREDRTPVTQNTSRFVPHYFL